jgi:hypothetical protein
MRLNGNFVALAKYRKYFDLNKENYTHQSIFDILLRLQSYHLNASSFEKPLKMDW